MSNIFLLSPELGEEDRFTACLHYLIDNIPELGQAIVDFILKESGKSLSCFIKAVEHPFCSLADRPDFILECEDFDIICEHKIASDLGYKQLERYLALESEKPFYVVLITNRFCVVSSEVIAKEHYLRPRFGQLAHYCWQDLYPIISQRSERLAREFVEYMRSLGMQPLQVKGWGDLFVNRETQLAFIEQWIEVRNYFKELGANCQRDGSGVGIQIRNTLPWLTLLYINITKAIKPVDMRLESPYLYANLYVPEDGLHRKAFENIDTIINHYGCTIAIRSCQRKADWNKKLMLVVEYYTSLAGGLSTDTQIMRKNLLEFAITVFNHARELGSQVEVIK